MKRSARRGAPTNADDDRDRGTTDTQRSRPGKHSAQAVANVRSGRATPSTQPAQIDDLVRAQRAASNRALVDLRGEVHSTRRPAFSNAEPALETRGLELSEGVEGAEGDWNTGLGALLEPRDLLLWSARLVRRMIVVQDAQRSGWSSIRSMRLVAHPHPVRFATVRRRSLPAATQHRGALSRATAAAPCLGRCGSCCVYGSPRGRRDYPKRREHYRGLSEHLEVNVPPPSRTRSRRVHRECVRGVPR